MDERIVFTNGCFDLFHVGHLKLLKQARNLGSHLIVGINSDESVRRLKGRDRPIIPQDQRAELVQSLWFVDGVVIFDEDDPLELIKAVRPDVLVKGGDWEEKDIIGADIVKARGGRVVTIPLVEGISTSKIIEAIRAW
jgi:D-beta-D-heptose 7-phosphate kinase/D-beta-D-heptose 1-phosphate adenosyltransferase